MTLGHADCRGTIEAMQINLFKKTNFCQLINIMSLFRFQDIKVEQPYEHQNLSQPITTTVVFS